EQLGELFEQVLAQAAVGTAVNRPLGHLQGTVYCRCSRAIGASAPSSLVTASAIASTVAAGTSPTAVTWWPSRSRENANAAPTLARPRIASVCGERGSMKTDTDASPSENTRCRTGVFEP